MSRPDSFRSPEPLPAALRGMRAPQHVTVLVADVEAFSSRTDTDQMRTREALYEEFRAAFGEELWALCLREDRGDGLLIVVPPRIPKAMVLGTFLPRLERALADRRRGDPLLRIRIAVHAGDVHFDEHGLGGHAVNQAFRLCDSAPLRAAIRTARSDSALLVSDAIHDNVVRGGYENISAASFHAVDVSVKETRTRAWLHVAGDDEAAVRVARETAAAAGRGTAAEDGSGEREPGRERSPERGSESGWGSGREGDGDRTADPTGGISLRAGGDLTIERDSMIAGRDISTGEERRRPRWRRS
ncbi:adenylate/guanylate cyclase [Streptomyces sp. NPDC051776]|uniref:adenylate/guanylate cyclase n=1 Tax=Streptomyces sp. NPDC051776 TaxID=3155414 RepID=UPI0034269D1F